MLKTIKIKKIMPITVKIIDIGYQLLSIAAITRIY